MLQVVHEQVQRSLKYRHPIGGALSVQHSAKQCSALSRCPELSEGSIIMSGTVLNSRRVMIDSLCCQRSSVLLSVQYASMSLEHIVCSVWATQCAGCNLAGAFNGSLGLPARRPASSPLGGSPRL